MNFKPLDQIDLNSLNLQLVQRRQRKETLREVYIEPNKFVYKRYLINRGAKFFLKPWLIEKKALLLTTKLRTPNHIEIYEGITKDGYYEIIHKRSYIDGEKLEKVDKKKAKKAARLLAKLHRIGVTPRDPHKHNFFEDDDGKLYFIDLGKARVHRFRSPLYLYDVGSEFAKLMHRTFEGNEKLMETFFRTYFKKNQSSFIETKLIFVAYRICVFNRKLRRRL